MMALRHQKHQKMILNDLQQINVLLCKVFWMTTDLIPSVVKAESGTSTEMPSAGPCQPIAEDLFYSTVQ